MEKTPTVKKEDLCYNNFASKSESQSSMSTPFFEEFPQLLIKCHECNSDRIWKDGWRTLSGGGKVQRFLCRSCGRRFSDPFQFQIKFNVTRQISELSESNHDLAHDVVAGFNLPSHKTVDDLPFFGSEDVGSHAGTVTGQLLNRLCDYNSTRRVSVSEREMENLAEVETRTEKWAAGATTDLKSLLFNFMWYLKKQGKATSTIELYVEVLKVLAKRGADINNKESVKKVIAMQESWSSSRKNNAVKSYSLFLQMQGKTWNKPKYKVAQKLPFIPNETEIDALIACCSKQMATFLQTCKETAGRRGEVFNLNWSTIDLSTNTVRITPEKGSNPRIIRISMKLATMLNNLQRIDNSEKVWIYKNTHYLDKQFRRQRKKAANKLANPRIRRIHFHTLRHWKATILCHVTNGNVYYVMRFLGHKSIKNTMRYIHLWQALFPQSEEYTCEIAGNLEEAKKLIEAGFEYITEMEGNKLFRKRETSLIGVVNHPNGVVG